MGKRHKSKSEGMKVRAPAAPEAALPALYERACSCAAKGQAEEARRIYTALAKDVPDRRVRALVCNDRAAQALLAGQREEALRGFREAVAMDSQCEVARFNLTFLEDELVAFPVDKFRAGNSHWCGTYVNGPTAAEKPPRSDARTPTTWRHPWTRLGYAPCARTNRRNCAA
jgi:hypothetical protein